MTSRSALRALWCLLLPAWVAGCATVPQPLTDHEIAARASADRNTIRRAAVPVDRPLSFSEAVAHALANNLEIRIANLDALLQRGAVDLADLQKLPSLVLNAGYTRRSEPAGTATDGIPGDRTRRTFSGELMWSILDFGISYIRAKQEANNLMVVEERKRRTANGVVNDVRVAFWQATLGAQRLLEIRAVASQIEVATKQSRRMAEVQLQDPLIALTYQEGLLDLQRQIKAYEGEITQAQKRLARLLTVHPDLELKLVPVRRDEAMRGLRKIDVTVLEEVALAVRSELREQDYTKRNRRMDIYAAYAQMLPNLRLRVAQMYDSQSTLLHNSWYEGGYLGAWNLIGIWQSYERANQAERTIASADLRRLAISMAVIEQTQTAREQLGVLDEDYDFARQTTEVRQRIWETRRDRLPFAETDELERIRSAVALVAAQIREDRAYAALQKAYGDLLASIGIDQFPDDLNLGTPEAAAAAIARHLSDIPQRVLLLSARIGAAGATESVPAHATTETKPRHGDARAADHR